MEDFKVEKWDRKKVLELFKELNFKRYIERFSLTDGNMEEQEETKKFTESYKIVEKTVKEEVIPEKKTEATKKEEKNKKK